MKPISATSGLGHPHSPPYPARALSSRAFGPRPSFRPFHSRRILYSGSAPSVHSMRIVSSGRSPVTTLRPACLDAACCLFTMHTVQAPLSIALSGSIHAASRAHVISRIQHTYTLLSVLRTCHARALLPDARSPRFGLSSPGTNNIIYPASALSLKKRAAMIHVILSLMRHTYVLRFARPSLPLYTLYLFLPCLFLRAACGVPSVSARCCPITLRIRSLLQPSAPRRMAPYTTVVRSLEYNRCPSPPQRCPYPRTTTALPRPHPSIYAAQYSTPRTPTLASIIAPPLRTTLRYATLHSSHGTSPPRTTTLRAPPSSFLHFHGSSILA